jgi:hypothetical protein
MFALLPTRFSIGDDLRQEVIRPEQSTHRGFPERRLDSTGLLFQERRYLGGRGMLIKKCLGYTLLQCC